MLEMFDLSKLKVTKQCQISQRPWMPLLCTTRKNIDMEPFCHENFK